MITVPDPKDLVEKIRKARVEKDLSINQIRALMKEKGYCPLGASSLSRILSGEEDESNYDYLYSILPLYNTLVDEITDKDEKIEALKGLLEYKKKCMEELKAQIDAQDKAHKEEIDNIKEKYRTKLEKETKKFQEIMDFRSDQIGLKDDRITKLLELTEKLTNHILECPYKGKC